MCSVAAKLVHSRHRPSGPRETLSGSHRDCPAPTLTPGMTSVLLVSGSTTRRSSWKGVREALTTLTALAAGDTSSTAPNPSRHPPGARGGGAGRGGGGGGGPAGWLRRRGRRGRPAPPPGGPPPPRAGGGRRAAGAKG